MATDLEFSEMEIVNRLPDRRGAGRGGLIPQELFGATIVNIGACANENSVEGGGLVVDFRTPGSTKIKRIVFGFTERGMWVEHQGHPHPLATAGAPQQ
jgi:hypothetical protein